MSTQLTPIVTTAAGVVVAAATAADATGNYFTNTGREYIRITNGGGSACNATIVTQGTYNVGATAYPIADLVVNVANSTTKAAGPFDKTLFNDANGRVQITYDQVTSVTVQVVTLGAS